MANIPGESLPLMPAADTAVTETIAERDDVSKELTTQSAATSGTADQPMLGAETIFPAAHASGALRVSAAGTVSPVASASGPVRMLRHAIQPDPENFDDEDQINDALDRASKPDEERQKGYS
jgi:hypothetical protein